MAGPELLNQAGRLCGDGGKDALQMWRYSFPAAVKEPGFLDASSAEIVELVFQTLPVYRELALQRAVLKFLKLCLHNETFLRTMAGALVRLGARKFPRQDAYVLLCWSCAVVRRLELPGARKAVIKLAECQAAYLNAILASSFKWHTAVRAAHAIWKETPALFELYMETLKANGSPGLARALLEFAAAQPGTMEAHKPAFLSVFTDKVLGAREALPLSSSSAYQQLAASLTQADFEQGLLPNMLRMAKRSPESVLQSAAAFIGMLRLDLDSLAERLAQEMIPMLRHSKDPVRSAAVKVVQAVAGKCSDEEPLFGMLAAFLQVLDGSAEGKLRNANERLGLVSAIGALPSTSSSGNHAAAVKATVFLAAYYKEEANEDVKLEALAALSAWLPELSTWPQPVLARLADGFRERDILRRAHLRALNHALLQNYGLHQGADSLAESLAKVISDGVSKPAQRADAIAALLAASILAAAESSVDSLLSAEKVWQEVSKEDSVLFSTATAGRLPVEEAAHAAQLVQHLLLQHAHRIPSSSATLPRLLAVLLLHHSAVVRRSAAEALTACVRSSDEGACRVLAALQNWLRTSPPLSVLLDPASAAADDPGVSGTAVAARYRRAAYVVAGAVAGRPQPTISSELLARLLLILSHPIVSQSRTSHRASWSSIRIRLAKAELITKEGAPAVLEHILGVEGVGSSDALEAMAAFRAVECLMQEAAEAVAPALLPHMEMLLDRREAEDLSPADLTIYHTPEGQIALKVDVTAIGENSGAFQFPAANGLRSKASLGSKSSIPNGSAAKNYASNPSPGRAKQQPGKAGGKETAQDRQNKQLQAEAVVRERVVGIRRRLEQGLHTLSAAALGDPSWTLANVDWLESLLQPLLGSPLVGEGAAFDTQVAIAGSLPGELGRHCLAIACSLRVVQLHRSGNAQDIGAIPEHHAIVEAVTAMAAATGGRRPLPLPAFGLCFPILAAVLSWPEHSPLHDPALATIALHVAPHLSVPRGKMLTLLYHVLGIIPAYRGRVQTMLDDLCRGVTDADMLEAFKGLLADEPHVRAAAVSALPRIALLAEGKAPDDTELVSILWLAQHDPDPANAEAALDVWDECGCALQENFVEPLLRFLCNPHSDIRVAAAEALAFGLQEVPAAKEIALSSLLSTYQTVGTWEARSGTALALQSCAAVWRPEDVTNALTFLMADGVTDDDEAVRSQMVDAGMALVDAHGADDAQHMLPLFESYLENKAGGNEEVYDRVRQGAVVFLGTLARHMDPGSSKVRDIVATLVDVLKTPSAEVQKAVAACLPPLMPGLVPNRSYLEELINGLLERLLKGKSYGDRKGAAYGIAGVVEGLKISAVNGYGILGKLETSLDDKDPNAREGALLAFECLVSTLGRLFEPFVVQIMGKLLDRYGDSSAFVREAIDHTSQTIMANLSGHGVKLVLPALLEGVEARAWRSKQGSVQMLGAMAHLAPQPLSTALPKVVPKLSQILSDPHPKVQSAARQALKEVGSVIRNPEIQKLVPSLLSAIAEPEKNAKKALDLMLGTTFVNTVDAASLALIVPVVHKSLRDRSGEAKKRASRIVGNMCALINEPKDMAPYVPLLIPELQQSLIDPLPEVRATAAKAMGSLLRGMGQHHFQDLMPWLLQTLKSEGSSVERSGAAQGMAEVLAVMGRQYLDALLPEILLSCSSKNPFVREGHLTLFKFLPGALQETFQEYLSTVLPAILDGLADESEGVRNAALAAGHTFVDLYATSALPLLLPAVEAGIVNDNWRIRQSSVELLGDLLFKVAGTSGKVRLENDDDEGISTEAHGVAIIEALGLARRNQILAKVYMARSDVGYSVRSAALHVWKTLVTNTPRTLSEILPYLMEGIIDLLAKDGEDQQLMAGACLGELVRKMGDRVLRQIIPILQAGMKNPVAATRVGVCTGLRELLENISHGQLKDHLSQLLPAVQSALVDPDPDVRQAAGSAFSILFRGSGGGSAVDSVIPSMLTSLTNNTKQSGQALEGLRVILGVRPQTLGTMLPRLLKPHVTSTSMRAIASLAEVAGPSIHGHLGTVMPPLLLAGSNPDADSQPALAAEDALKKISSAVAEEGVYLLVAQLDKGLEDPSRRLAAAKCIKYFCQTSRLDYQEHLPGLISALVSLLSEEDTLVLQACWEALAAATGTIPKEMLAGYCRPLREAVATAREKQRRKRKGGELLLPGLSLPKALAPVLPIYLQGVLQGASAELRELAAEGLGELVEATSTESLRPFVVQITGPLIRIIGDRFPWEIKSAILKTLGLLICKAGPGLKPFVPQLQTTFLKCLPDQARQVRQKAAENLGQLSAMSARVDALANDLVSQAQSAAPGLKESYLTALSGVLAHSGARLTPATRSSAGTALQNIMSSAGGETSIVEGAASCLGEYGRHCEAAALQEMLLRGPLASTSSSGSEQGLAAALTLAAVTRLAAKRVKEVALTEGVVSATVRLARDESPAVKEAISRAAGHLAMAELRGELPQGSALPQLVPVFVAMLGPDQASEVQRQQLHVLRALALEDWRALEPHFNDIIPSLCSLLSGGSGPTKLATERTLSRVLQAAEGPHVAQRYLATPGPGITTARAILNDAYLRRLSKLPLDDLEDRNFD